MPNSLDKWLKIAAIASLLLAGSGVFYYYAVFRPQLDRATLVGATTAVPASRQRVAVLTPAADHCRQAARLHHDVSWAAACMQEQARHAACVNDRAIMVDPARGRAYCDRLHGEADGNSECTLPDARAAVVNAALAEAEKRCAVEAKTASR